MTYSSRELKTLETTPDGRIIIKKRNQAESFVKGRPQVHLPDDFMLVIAYGEKCISGFDQEEISTNMRIMARYVGPDDPMRKKYDNILVGCFIPIFKKRA